MNDHCSILLSYGFAHRQEAFDANRKGYEMIALLDGYIFTDVLRNPVADISVYQDNWMRHLCEDCIVIGITGDKGQAAHILDKPCILFDDKEDNLLQVIQARQGNEACHVQLSRKFAHQWQYQAQGLFHVSTSVGEWIHLSQQFRDAHQALPHPHQALRK